MQQQTLESDENRLSLGLGLFQKSQTFYSIAAESRAYECQDCLLNINFSMDLTTMSHQRRVFTFQDFEGNGGGLYGILVIIGSQIVTAFNFVIGSNLERFLAAQIFFFE